MSNGPHQDVILRLDQTFKGMPSTVRAIADQATEQTGLSLTEDDVSVTMGSDDNLAIVVHTGGPDVTHSDIMKLQQIVSDNTGANVEVNIVRAKA